MWATSLSLVAVAAIALAMFGAGRLALRALYADVQGALEVSVWSLAAGIFLSATFSLACARLGWLTPFVFAGATLLAGLWGTLELASAVLANFEPRTGDLAGLAVRQRFRFVTVDSLLIWPAIFVAVLALIQALAPPTAASKLAQALDVPKGLLLSQGIAGGDESILAPTMTHLLSLSALALDGPVAVGLLHWGLGLLAAAATMLAARPLLGDSSSRVAAALAILAPGMYSAMSAPGEALLCLLFSVLALTAFLRVVLFADKGKWPVLAGVAAAASLLASQAGALFAVALVVVWIEASLTRRALATHLRQTGLVALLAALVASTPWLLLAPQQHFIPWQAVAAHGALGLWTQLGPVVVASVAGLAFARRLHGLPAVCLLAAAYVALTLLTSIGHAWAPLLPLAAIMGAWVWQELSHFPRPALLLARTALAAIALWLPLGESGKISPLFDVAIGRQSRQDFLLTQVGMYRAAQLVNALARPGERVFSQDASTFYFSAASGTCNAPTTPLPGSFDGESKSLEELAVTLTDARNAGYSYFLAKRDIEPDSSAGDGGQWPASDAERWQNDPVGQIISILDYRFADDNCHSVRYTLFMLR